MAALCTVSLNVEPQSKYPSHGMGPVALAPATELSQSMATVGTHTLPPTAIVASDCNVMFMWQPLTQIVPQSVTLLGSFQVSLVPPLLIETYTWDIPTLVECMAL